MTEMTLPAASVSLACLHGTGSKHQLQMKTVLVLDTEYLRSRDNCR